MGKSSNPGKDSDSNEYEEDYGNRKAIASFTKESDRLDLQGNYHNTTNPPLQLTHRFYAGVATKAGDCCFTT